MKTLFMPAKAVGNVKLVKKESAKLPEKVGLCTTVQLVDQLKDVKKQLREAGKKVFIGKGKQPAAGQVLGCDQSAAEAVKDKVDAFMY
ncbi:hypothetical protein GF351_00460, partial [Candidatus Woesearchaeota archaeon]|nr:hypothetical protein [Candidatus Woesearchaeota archaeon]